MNNTTGNSVPSAAALMGLSGISPRIQVRSDSASAGGMSIDAVARSRAVASGSSTSVLNHGGATTTVKIAQAIARPNIHAKALAPTRPVRLVSPPPATPTMSSGTTSGITVMRTALIHAVPTTSSTAISPRVNAEGDASCESHMPRARPSNRPSVTWTACDRSGLRRGKLAELGAADMRANLLANASLREPGGGERYARNRSLPTR